MREKLSDNSLDNRKKNVTKNASKYSHVNGIESNNFEAYMKDYKRRYRKKNGLFKIDCYCEKRVLDKINHLYGFGEKLQKKKRFKKYFIISISIALIPALGLIYPMLFGVKEWGEGIIKYCVHDSHKPGGTAHANCEKTILYDYKEILQNIGDANYFIFPFIGVIILLLFIYILIKVIKYRRLISGK
ncbi:hypothetical protein PVIIG_05722 [Plasmodium vivax India VII]|uniref:Variable surface protein Vir35 n=1 Tax=Plasmodium vivax India VII TaxID=1077284 RepID=A0A0J9S3G9_PLAVI|nr:hypothetical protein PVIIG_05722 [Plasmodium vivax India VII]